MRRNNIFQDLFGLSGRLSVLDLSAYVGNLDVSLLRAVRATGTWWKIKTCRWTNRNPKSRSAEAGVDGRNADVAGSDGNREVRAVGWTYGQKHEELEGRLGPLRRQPLSPGFDPPKAPNSLANACCI